MTRRRAAALALALALAWVAAGCKRRYEEGGRGGQPPPPPDAAPVPRDLPEGAPSEAAVFERAQKAYAAGDYEVVYHCIAPAVRRSWLNTLVIATFFATMGHVGEGEGTPLGALADVMHRQGAELSVEERLSGVDLETVGPTLLGRARDPAALFAGFLTWADKHGAHGDPMKGIQSPERQKLVVAQIDPDKGIVDTLSANPPTTGLDVNIPGPPGLPALLSRLSPPGPAPKDQRFTHDGAVFFLTE